jgi:hypothetical protein
MGRLSKYRVADIRGHACVRLGSFACRVMALLATISGTLNWSYRAEAECFRIFRADQRALGELMIVPDGGPGGASMSRISELCRTDPPGASRASRLQAW